MTSITMPQMGETITEGTVAKWLKREGDLIEKDEPLVEISTDKVDTEVPSPVGGKIAKILVGEGETVSAGAEIATIEESGATERQTERRPEEVGRTGVPTSERESPGFISPVVRKLASEKNVDLAALTGSGAGGRITKKDVLAATEKAFVKPSPPAPVVTGREEVVKMTLIRKAIAEHMLESSRSTAHVTAIVEVDMENIAKQRSRFKSEFKRREGFSLTYLPFVARATCATLAEFPHFNSELRGDELIIKRYVNLAVAVDRPDGLVTPVIEDAGSFNLAGLARTIADAAGRARGGKLKHAETTGGTFTLTNPGSIGSIIQTPIINPPQVAVLSLEKIEERVVPVEGGIGVKKMVYMPLTYDHRVVDGADAARFLVRVKERLETWDFSPELAEYDEGLRRAA